MSNKKTNNCDEPYVGPYPITQVWNNGNFTIHQGAVQEHIKLYGLNPITNNNEISVRQGPSIKYVIATGTMPSRYL